MSSPLVTIICVCYNQARFVTEALDSVMAQTYKPIELIVIDDGSTDGSVKIIKHWISNHPETTLLINASNLGYCKTFNKAFNISTGAFCIDLAADDVLLPTRIIKQMDKFQVLPVDVGVVFTDAEYINESGNSYRNHYEYLFRKGLLNEVPQGDVYAKVLSTYFIASPTMMIRRQVLEALKGYDEELAYEDFDFWVRSARLYKYVFLNEILTRIRRTGESMSSRWYQQGDRQLHSTYLVCKKAQKQNQNQEESDALIKRVRFEIRQSVFSKNTKEAELFFKLLTELTDVTWIDRALVSIRYLPIPFRLLRNLYHSIRFS